MNDRSPTYTRFWIRWPAEAGGNASQRLAAIFVSFFNKNGQRTLGFNFRPERKLLSIYFGKNLAIKIF